MNSTRQLALIALTPFTLALSLSACDGEIGGGVKAERGASIGTKPTASASPSASGATAGADPKHDHGKKAEAKGDGHDHGKASADGGAELDLKGVMAQLSGEMVGIQEGLWKDDFAKISKHSRAIAEHPHVGPSERARLNKTLGKDFAEFVKADRQVHDTALRLQAAADKSDMTVALEELGKLQKGCVGCHASFRKRLTTP